MKNSIVFITWILLLSFTSRSVAGNDPAELCLICRGITQLAKELAKPNASPTSWLWGNVNVSLMEDDQRPLEEGNGDSVFVRKIVLSVKGSDSIKRQNEEEHVNFQVNEIHLSKGYFRRKSSKFLVEILNQRKWYESNGALAYQFNSRAEGINKIILPCKMPEQWGIYMREAIDLRTQNTDWFLPFPDKNSSIKLKKDLSSPNPIWRLCVICRLLKLKQIDEEDIKKLLNNKDDGLFEQASLLVILLNDLVFYEQFITELIHSKECGSNTLEGVALGCLTSASAKPSAVEKAFKSLQLLKKIKSQASFSMLDQERLIDAFFSSDEDREYRIAHKLNYIIEGNDGISAQKIRSILSYTFTP